MINDPNYYHIEEFFDVLWRLGILPSKYKFISLEEDEFTWVDDDDVFAGMYVHSANVNLLSDEEKRSRKVFYSILSKIGIPHPLDDHYITGLAVGTHTLKITQEGHIFVDGLRYK